MFDELRLEENQELLKRIARLTKEGKIKWECVEYNPLSFMDKDDYDETSAYLCQMFTLTTHIEGLPYELELAEYITIPDGKGDVAITLTRDVEDDFLKIDEMVSGDLDAYNDCSPEAIAEVFKDNPAMALSTILVPQFADTEVVKETFAWARFINENGISDDLLSHPLTQLAEKLFNEGRVLDYHRMIFDTPYRDKLLAE